MNIVNKLTIQAFEAKQTTNACDDHWSHYFCGDDYRSCNTWCLFYGFNEKTEYRN